MSYIEKFVLLTGGLEVSFSIVRILVKPRYTRPCLTERLLMGRKESNQSNKQTNKSIITANKTKISNWRACYTVLDTLSTIKAFK